MPPKAATEARRQQPGPSSDIKTASTERSSGPSQRHDEDDTKDNPHSNRDSVAPSTSLASPYQPRLRDVSKNLYRSRYLPYYLAGAGSGARRGIVLATDIYGLLPNAYQVCDAVSDAGFVVIMPDFFHGVPWPVRDFPPEKGFGCEEWSEFMKCAQYSCVKADIQQAIDILRTSFQCHSVGMMGICWGGKMAARANMDRLVDATALVHPSFLDLHEADGMMVPCCFVTSHDEESLMAADPRGGASFKQTVEERLSEGRQSLLWEHFPTLRHGFMGSSGIVKTDYADDAVRAQVEAALAVVVSFFQRELK